MTTHQSVFQSKIESISDKIFSQDCNGKFIFYGKNVSIKDEIIQSIFDEEKICFVSMLHNDEMHFGKRSNEDLILSAGFQKRLYMYAYLVT